MEPLPLPAGITSRMVTTGTGLQMHLLAAGNPADPALLLLHGFPELAYSWRKIMPALAAAGYYVLAPDQRGYGRTTGWDVDNLGSFRFLNLVRDAMGLLRALGIDRVAAVVGHDFGASVAGWAASLQQKVMLVRVAKPGSEHLGVVFRDSEQRREAYVTLPSETIEEIGIYRYEQGKRDRQLQRLWGLEENYRS